MGMFDEVRCEADLPPGHPPDARDFQTKSLLNCLDNFTITKEGRLIHHPCRYEPVEKSDGIRQPLFSAIPLDDVDTEYHGDLRLTSTVEGPYREYVARFTHGTLEWIRPWPEMSKLHQLLLDPY